MRIDTPNPFAASQAAAPQAAGPSGRAPESPEAAARQFEEVLAKQFVSVMTASLFDGSAEGEGGPGWMSGYRDSQRDVLTDALAGHLVDSGALGIRDRLLRQWGAAPPPAGDRNDAFDYVPAARPAAAEDAADLA